MAFGKHTINASVLLLSLGLGAWRRGPRKEIKVGGGEAQNSHEHLGASGSGAELQGCCQHEHSGLEEKSTSALTLGPSDATAEQTAKKTALGVLA